MYVYPSIFEETFCISLLECMAGFIFHRHDFGALYKRRANVYTNANHRAMAQKFGFGIEQASYALDQKQIHDI